ncbi:MAG: TetR/AcrR family transcriptional regulator [Pseudomonadota bacterium]
MTRQALLTLAEDLSRQNGFDAFSYADLSRALGITKAAVHHHFPTKAALAQALVDDYSTRVLTELAALNGHPADQLRRFVALYRAASADGTRLCLCVAYGAMPARQSEAVQGAVAQFHTDVTAWLTPVTAALPAVTLPAPALLALVEGAQIMARAAGTIAPFDAATQPLLAQLETPV